MGNVYVADGDSQSETAVLLLAAAEELDLRPEVVQRYTGQHSGWQVPAEVAKKAGLDTYDPYEDLANEVDAAKADLPDDEDSDEPNDGNRFVRQPDPEEGAEATGHIDPGPTAEEAQAAFDDSDEAPDDVKAKRSARKSTARKTAAKKSTANKEN